MDRERDWKGEFSLAFLEELEQGGAAFRFERDKNFIKKEYPHYSGEFEAAMNKLYKLWKDESDKLPQTKKKLEDSVGRETAQAIRDDRSLRFFILKTLHDSCIDNLMYDEKSGVLRMEIDYDDAFCKIPFGTSLVFVFSGVKEFVSDVPDFSEAYLLLGSTSYEVENGVKVFFAGMDMNREWVNWEISFRYDTFEIMPGEEREDDDCEGEV